MKPLAHTAMIAGGLNTLNFFPLPHGLTVALDLLHPGAFTIFAASTAAALHQRLSLVILTLGLVLILAAPTDLQGVATLLIPLGMGIVAGNFCRRLVLEEQNGKEPSEHVAGPVNR